MGLELTPKPLSANKFFEYEKRKTSQSVAIANQWISHEAYYETYPEMDLEKLRFREKGRLLAVLTSAKVIFNDDLPLAETSDFTVSGNRFTEREDSGDAFDRFLSEATANPLAAYRWVTPKVLLMNGEEISQSHFDLVPPDGIGFEAMAIIVQWLSAFLS